ncbi:MAG: ribonuclease T2 family protein [Janthinobacterium lividum]
MLDLLLTLAAAAVGASCAIPADLAPAPVTPAEEQRLLPTTNLVLAYYWWPQECRRDDEKGTASCAAGFGFKVHGLWPDAANRTWPQFCATPTPIDLKTVRANYCTTPSPSLMQHEWAKHGTCGWPTPAAYFAQERAVAATVTLPDVDKLPAAGLTVGAIRDAIVAANPAVPRASLFVATDRNQWLTEVRVCLDLAFKPAACEAGDSGAADRATVRVWPR